MTTAQASIPTIPTTLELVELARSSPSALWGGPARPDCGSQTASLPAAR